jgi:hypothetical protein
MNSFNADYEQAKCAKSHEDGTTCRPSWDGFDYYCIYSMVHRASIDNESCGSK